MSKRNQLEAEVETLEKLTLLCSHRLNAVHGACGGCIPGLACHKGSVNGKSSYSHIGRHTKKI